MIETRLKALYKDKIAADIQDIYRELESYSAIIDSRIGRLKTLTERHEANIKAWENIQTEMKKSRTGKEFLSFLSEIRGEVHSETRQNIKPDPEFSKNLKNEIIRELKNYLAVKLNLPPLSKSQNAAPEMLSRPAQPVKGRSSSELTENKRANTKMQNEDLDSDDKNEDAEFNVAEQIIDDIDAFDAMKSRQRLMTSKNTASAHNSPLNTSQAAFISTKAPGSINPKTAPAKQPDVFSPEPASNTFLNILSSVGRALSPLFMKPAGAETPGFPASTAFDKRPAGAGNFNDLLKKEITTTGAIAQTRKVFIKDDEAGIKSSAEEADPEKNAPAPGVTSKKLIKSMEPAELVKLIEALKTSRQRPEALKNLLNQGFQMEQIAELSNVPFSDLELTRNLYHI